MYVGRNSIGQCGKLELDNGTMWNISCHGARKSDKGEVLVVLPHAIVQWTAFRKGDDLPAGVVKAGQTVSDGDVYVARSPDGAGGKLNVNGRKCHNLWVYGHVLAFRSGDVLVVLPGADIGRGSAAASPLDWNPLVLCEGIRAQERAQWFVDNLGLARLEAEEQVMREFPALFRGGFWNPHADCRGTPAQELARRLVADEGMGETAARQKLMQDFPGKFGVGWSDDAICGESCAGDLVQRFVDEEGLSHDAARRKVMWRFPDVFS